MLSNLEKLRNCFRDESIDFFGITTVLNLPQRQAIYDEWIQQRKHGQMSYLKDHAGKKCHPEKILPQCRAIIMIGLNYYQKSVSVSGAVGRIARYAWGRDYHRVLGKKLRRIAAQLQQDYPDEQFYSHTDATPLLERAYAEKVGLGFVGKNTMVISPVFGSWFVIGEILTTLPLPEVPATSLALGSCGTCRRCLDICPTGALVGPYELDARKCISYLTIEHKGSIPEHLRPLMGNWLFGCDLCQEVCPHNTRAKVTLEQDFVKRFAGEARELKEILEIETEEEYLKKFAGSPLMRAKRTGLLRNACIVAANVQAKELLPILEKRSQDHDPVIAEHAQWALEQLV